jgi:hypothetical protein
MAERVPQATVLEVMFMAYLASDHLTPATGKTIPITISKNHGGLGNPNAGATNATAVSNGCYYVALDTTDTGTLGNLWVHGAEATIDDVNVFYRVVSANSPVDLQTVKGQGVTCAAPVTVLASVGTAAASTTQTADVATLITTVGAAGAGLTAVGDTAGTTTLLTRITGAVGSVSDVAAAILVTPANLLATDTAGRVDLVNAPNATALTAAADALLDRSNAIETGWTVRMILRILSAAFAKVSGYPAGPGVFRNVTDTKARITATNDADGNRSSVTFDGS